MAILKWMNSKSWSAVDVDPSDCFLRILLKSVCWDIFLNRQINNRTNKCKSRSLMGNKNFNLWNLDMNLNKLKVPVRNVRLLTSWIQSEELVFNYKMPSESLRASPDLIQSVVTYLLKEACSMNSTQQSSPTSGLLFDLILKSIFFCLLFQQHALLRWAAVSEEVDYFYCSVKKRDVVTHLVLL